MAGTAGGDASAPWQSLAQGYEAARAREDSLDRLVEWPAQRAVLGDVVGRSVLDVGCGNGAKLVAADAPRYQSCSHWRIATDAASASRSSLEVGNGSDSCRRVHVGCTSAKVPSESWTITASLASTPRPG